jgi:hypothetical protein
MKLKGRVLIRQWGRVYIIDNCGNSFRSSRRCRFRLWKPSRFSANKLICEGREMHEASPRGFARFTICSDLSARSA